MPGGGRITQAEQGGGARAVVPLGHMHTRAVEGILRIVMGEDALPAARIPGFFEKLRLQPFGPPAGRRPVGSLAEHVQPGAQGLFAKALAVAPNHKGPPTLDQQQVEGIDALGVCASQGL